jgi:homocysteine S-methyltransferase
LTSPDLVRDAHAEYVRAGAEIIETNTFGATAPKLQQYGLEASLRDINVSAARLAREAAAGRALVAGRGRARSGLRIEPYGPTSFDEANQLFASRSTRCSKAASTSSCSRHSPTSRKCDRPSAPCATPAICPWWRR